MALTGTCRNESRSGGSTGLAAGAILSIGPWCAPVLRRSTRENGDGEQRST